MVDVRLLSLPLMIQLMNGYNNVEGKKSISVIIVTVH